ncbi:MAG TPA: hypothetical protein VFU73_07410 [Actinocrinis sp.]|nr:hypothetical protein [Actinocrinis sp.]
MSTVTDIPVAQTRGYDRYSHFPARSNAMSLMQYQLVKEMHRERLRQAEHYRLHRVALRARRMLAQSLMR